MNWSPVTLPRFTAFSLSILAIVGLELRPPLGWVPLLDGANLLFHEAGHLFFGVLGETAGLYGGTLGQLVFPLAVSIGFWRQRAAISLAFGCLWFFENFFNIARYAADARTQELPLVGGGEHDWWNIVSRWGVLEHDVAIAITIAGVGLTGILATWAWAGWRCFYHRSDIPS